MKNTWLKCKILRNGDLVREQDLNKDVVKIGSLRSSEVHLDGVARMHAVLERTHGEWRLIDLGSSLGCGLDDVRVDKSALLPPTGKLQFGAEWSIEFETMDGPAPAGSGHPLPYSATVPKSVSPPSEAQEGPVGTTLHNLQRAVERRMSPDANHHRELAEALLEKLKEFTPEDDRSELDEVIKGWPLLSTEDKRRCLRLLVQGLRQTRSTVKSVYDQISGVSTEEIRAIYELEPEEAFEKAYTCLADIALAKAATDALEDLKLDKTMEKDRVKHVSEGDADKAAKMKKIMAVHERLRVQAQSDLWTGIIRMTLYMGRAAGEEFSEEEHGKLIDSFHKVKGMEQVIGASSA